MVLFNQRKEEKEWRKKSGTLTSRSHEKKINIRRRKAYILYSKLTAIQRIPLLGEKVIKGPDPLGPKNSKRIKMKSIHPSIHLILDDVYHLYADIKH